MKRNLLRALVVSLFAFALGAAVKSQELDRLVVNIPHDFVLSGKSLPAGTYKVQRYSDSDSRQLIVINAESNNSVLAVSREVRSARATHPGVTLEQSGQRSFLTQIRTDEHVFVLLEPGSALKTATANSD
jgi:hypothetical protein